MRLTVDQLRRIILKELHLVPDPGGNTPEGPPPGWEIVSIDEEGVIAYERVDGLVAIEDLRSVGMGIEVTVTDKALGGGEEDDYDESFETLEDAFSWGDIYSPHSRVRARY